jgi:hypothetical protein
MLERGSVLSREDVFRHDVNADVVFLAHEEEEAVHVMPEMDLRLPRAEIMLCRRLSRDRLLAAGSANCCRVVRDAEA